MVYSNQTLYYQAIEQSSKKADCAPFLEFMLGEILETLRKYRRNSDGINTESIERQMEVLIWKNNRITARELSELLGITLRNVKKRMATMKKAGRLIRKGSRKSGYWQIVD